MIGIEVYIFVVYIIRCHTKLNEGNDNEDTINIVLYNMK